MSKLITLENLSRFKDHVLNLLDTKADNIKVIHTTETNLALEPNTFHIWDDPVASLTITIPLSGYAEYSLRFTSPETATTLTLPATVIIPDGFEIAPNQIYEISIVDNYLTYQKWSVS